MVGHHFVSPQQILATTPGSTLTPPFLSPFAVLSSENGGSSIRHPILLNAGACSSLSGDFSSSSEALSILKVTVLKLPKVCLKNIYNLRRRHAVRGTRVTQDVCRINIEIVKDKRGWVHADVFLKASLAVQQHVCGEKIGSPHWPFSAVATRIHLHAVTSTNQNVFHYPAALWS